jgi:hypothetical protein
MQWIIAKFKWVMLVAGLLTCTMIQALLAPEKTSRSLFGTSLEGPLAEIFVRSWGALVTLIGAMLIYGAFRPVHRAAVLIVAGISKATFIGLVLVFGRSFLEHQVGVAIVIDAVMVLLFAGYLIATRHDWPAA